MSVRDEVSRLSQTGVKQSAKARGMRHSAGARNSSARYYLVPIRVCSPVMMLFSAVHLVCQCIHVSYWIRGDVGNVCVKVDESISLRTTRRRVSCVKSATNRLSPNYEVYTMRYII